MKNLVVVLMVLAFAAALLPAGDARALDAPDEPSAAPDAGRLVLLSKLDGPPLPAGLDILEDYGPFVLARIPDTMKAALPPPA